MFNKLIDEIFEIAYRVALHDLNSQVGIPNEEGKHAIKSLIHQHTKDVLEKVRMEKEQENHEHEDNWCYTCNENNYECTELLGSVGGYNQAISEINTKIDELEKELSNSGVSTPDKEREGK